MSPTLRVLSGKMGRAIHGSLRACSSHRRGSMFLPQERSSLPTIATVDHWLDTRKACSYIGCVAGAQGSLAHGGEPNLYPREIRMNLNRYPSLPWCSTNGP